ncbi:MAG: AAA family ATPase [Lachnospiraceae bacterium]|nr:AAA family ATPase [Lachnospiraceae bacterium]
MSEYKEYLALVQEKIKERIEELEKSIQQGNLEIQAMNDYYWENYTEMDEYGYENYDNQRTLFARVDANRESRISCARLKKMWDSPFFGKVEFLYDGDEQPEEFYIGIANFSDPQQFSSYIYDWRAPISSLFYDYDKGPASYEAPDGTFTGEIKSKWQYKIKNGKVVYAFESDFKIDDEILKEELGKNGEVKLKNIIRTIQAEQNAIIRNRKDKALVIQGAAGSGKTSIALHRIAYLLYHERNTLKSSNVLILSPNTVFADYISHILPELGEENIQEMSLDIFAYRKLRGIAKDCEDRYHHIEKRMEQEKELWASGNHPTFLLEIEEADKRYRFKQSKDCVDAMEGFFIELEDRLIEFRDISYKKMAMRAKEMQDLFYDKFAATPILSRIDVIRERFLDEYETLYGAISENDLIVLQEKFDSLYVTKDLYEIYNWFLADMDFPLLKDLPKEERILDYEDVYPLLYMQYCLEKAPVQKTVRHLVIDEMQDYSYLQYVLLCKMFPCNKTILGDKSQTVEESGEDIRGFLPKLLGKDTKMISMNKSYRNTREIAAYAGKFLTDAEIQYFDRHGKAVEEKSLENMDAVMEDVKNKLQETEVNYETVAILTMSMDSAKEIHKTLAEDGIKCTLLDRDSVSFQKGLTITTYYFAKGLEFDQVFLMPENKQSSHYNQFQYIGATRALHELYVYH